VSFLHTAPWPAVATAAFVIWSAWHRTDIVIGLVVLAVPFSLIERWLPLRRQRPAFRRPGAATDLVSFLVNEVVAALGLAAVLLIGVPVLRLVVPFRLADALAGQPGSVRWFAAFAASEVGGYWGHRLSHEIPMLWRFHRVHHSARQLDWLAPNRRHPVDAIIARSSTALPVLALGFAVPTVATHFALKRLQGLFVHSNTRLRFGPFERVVVTPFFHHWHHSAVAGTWNTNYAGSLPVVDWIFGTMQLPGRWPQEYGCDGDVPDVGYVARFMSAWTRPKPRLLGEACSPKPSGDGWEGVELANRAVVVDVESPHDSFDEQRAAPAGIADDRDAAAANVAQQRSHQLAVGAEHGVG
jgi:sterol desaturase/sphingolipid hydroxylase (fatty acid hydroxylase superfamily)